MITDAKTGVTQPEDHRALVAIDLGAESCRVSLLRWGTPQSDPGQPRPAVPSIAMIHRFPNGPVESNGHLHWPLDKILSVCREQRGIGKKFEMASKIVGADVHGRPYSNTA